MNYPMIWRILGHMILFEAAFMSPSLFVAAVYREKSVVWLLVSMLVCIVIGLLLTRLIKAKEKRIYAREGSVICALVWVLYSILGALPFRLSGYIPNMIDAVFETASGFTTTGASILNDVEALPHWLLFWRSFTHWVGGMGVFVFMLAVLPMTGAQNMHLMRSESPGPDVGKLVPKLGDSAKILYTIYFGMTVLQIIILLISGMPLFDSITLTFGTAGTGGFGIYNTSIAGYTYIQQLIISIFMVLFGINFNFYFFIIIRRSIKEAINMDEVKTYLAIIAASTALIMWNARNMFESIEDGFIKSFFQVSSIITTTGYSTADFDRWPALSKTILVCLMFIGACAGSTGGGFKISRLIIMAKSYVRELRHFIHPRLVKNLYMDGRKVKDATVSGVKVYLVSYVLVLIVSMIIISLDGFDFETNFTAVMATLNNIGPGLSVVGPAGNFDGFSIVSKYVLSFDMLAGRLELYPMLLLFAPGTWRKR